MAISDTPDPGNAKPSDDKDPHNHLQDKVLPPPEQDRLEEQQQQPLHDDLASDYKLNQFQGEGGTVDDGIPNNDKQLQHTPKDSASSNPKKRGRRSASADKGEAAATVNPPASADRPARERKLVERYSASPSAKAVKSLSIPEGSGAQLKDIPNVAFKLSKLKADDNLQVLHMILFGKKAKAHSLKRNIGRFSGYVWSDDEQEKHRAKVKDKLDKCIKEKLVYFCDLLNIPFNKATAKKEDLAVKLLDFLESPHTTTDVVLAEKEQGLKRKRKSEPSKPVSSGEASAEGTEKKRKKRAKDVEKQKTSSAIEQDANADDNVPDSGSGDDSYEDNEIDKGSAEEVGLVENKSENEEDAKEEADKEDNSSGKEKAKEAIVEAGNHSKPKKKATSAKSSKGASMVAEEEADNEGNSSGEKKVKEAKVKSGDSSKPKKKASQAKSSKSPSTAAKKSPSSKKIYENAGGSPAILKGSDLKKKSEDSKDRGASLKGKSKSSSSKKNNENAGGTSGTPASKKLLSKSPGKAFVKDQGESKTSKKAKAGPTRKEMHDVVEEILKEVDFNTATLSDILKQLGARFGVDLYSRKAEVKEIITDVINKMSDEEDEEDAKSDDADE